MLGTTIYWLGFGIGVTLIALLLATLAGLIRLWPTPGEKTWQSYVFWPLFRGLNLLCFAAALLLPFAPITAVGQTSSLLGLPFSLRVIAFAVMVGAIALFLYAFFKLGRDNSYGAQDGLVTAGIYQWSRNPQNALLMLVYACLLLATDTARVAALSAMMIVVYFLMVLCEEPWLEKAYGDAYRRYCASVPRFFSLGRLVGRP